MKIKEKNKIAIKACGDKIKNTKKRSFEKNKNRLIKHKQKIVGKFKRPQ